MSLTEILTLIALLLSLAALIVVSIQTVLTRKSLDATRESINLSRKVRELEMLPRANLIIKVHSDLKKWNEEFQNTIIELRKISSKQDRVGLKSVAQKGLRSPKGIIDKYIYEHCPNWLAVIWTTGAQYYYDAKAPQCGLWIDHNDEPNFSFIEIMISRYQESIKGLSELLGYVIEIVPSSYLESPASINEVSFLSD